eukprot:gene278-6693_t
MNSMKKGMTYPLYLNIFAFIFCGFGDFFLAINATQNTELHFKLGILAFLIAQLSFTYMFKFKIGKYNETSPNFNLLYFLPFLIYGVSLVVILKVWELNFVLRIAVPIYALAICSMATSATTSLFANNITLLSLLRVSGSISFIFSDSLIAIGAFSKYYQVYNVPSNIVKVTIMITYWIALYFFAISFEEIYQEGKEKNK